MRYILLLMLLLPTIAQAMHRTPSARWINGYASSLAHVYGLPDSVVAGVIMVESSGRIKARGKHGEVGLMQMKLSTAREVSGNAHLSASALRKPVVNLALGIRHLANLRKQFHGDLRLALLAYNRGPAAVYGDLFRGHVQPDRYLKLVKHYSQPISQVRFR